ncbi:MAG: hypothetical protein ACREXU_10680 [Gammaproteobacteria bacterium]
MKTSPHPQQSFMSEQLEAWVLDDFRDLPLFRKILADQSLETFGGRSAPALDQHLFEYLFEP